MASKKEAPSKVITDDAPEAVAEPAKPAAKTKQAPVLSLDRQQVIAALNAGIGA